MMTANDSLLDLHPDYCRSCGEMKCCPGCDIKVPEPAPPTKAQLWRRVARLAGELMFGVPTAGTFGIAPWNTAIEAIRRLMANVQEWLVYLSDDNPEKIRCERILAKLEAALKAWEVAT